MKLKNSIHLGDSKRVLDGFPDESIDLTFTSPPYFNARDYSQYNSYNEYLTAIHSVLSRVHRVTKEGRYLVVNTSPVIEPRQSRQHKSHRYAIPFDLNTILQANGWDFIDDIIWVKPEPSVKNRNGGFFRHRKPLAYKPNVVTEYLMVYRKRTDRLIDWNLKQYDEKVVEQSKVVGEYETGNVWEIAPKSDKNHSAVFPEKLCENVIKLYSMVGDVVLDPFAGSGTVGVR